jgi:hypothetical protein
MNNLDLGTPVAYEPCANFQADDDAALCACCGWAEDDHDAVVVELGHAATTLRQAS